MFLLCVLIGFIILLLGIFCMGATSELIFNEDDTIIYRCDTVCCYQYKYLSKLGRFDDFQSVKYEMRTDYDAEANLKRYWVYWLQFKNDVFYTISIEKDDVERINDYFARYVSQRMSVKLHLYDDTKQIDERNQLIVSGFIRHCANLLLLDHQKTDSSDSNINPYYIIPTDIADICFNYYFDSEYFFIVGKDITISGDKLNVTKSIKNATWNNTTYGRQLISAHQSNQSVYKWKIKLVGYRGGGILIGIISTNDSIIDQPFHKIKDCICYGYNVYNGKKMSNDGFLPFTVPSKKGYTIVMVLDMNLGVLQYRLYGLKHNITACEIKRGPNIKYRLAVSIGWKDSQLSIQSFQIN